MTGSRHGTDPPDTDVMYTSDDMGNATDTTDFTDATDAMDTRDDYASHYSHSVLKPEYPPLSVGQPPAMTIPLFMYQQLTQVRYFSTAGAYSNLLPSSPEIYAVPLTVVPESSLSTGGSALTMRRASERTTRYPGGLPDDIIFMILLALRDLYRDDRDTDGTARKTWYLAPRVNRTWWRLFLDFNALWTVVDLSFHERLPRGETNRAMRLPTYNRWQTKICRHMQRAGNRTLALCYFQGLKRNMNGELCAIINCWLTQGRVRELQIHDDPGASHLQRSLQLFVRPAWNLETLVIKAVPFEARRDTLSVDYLHKDVKDISKVIGTPPDLFAEIAPKLTTVVLVGCIIPWVSPILRNGLQHFSVQVPNMYMLGRAVRPSMVLSPEEFLPAQLELMQILDSARFSLKYLNLLHALPGSNIDCNGLLQRLELPASCSLTVYCYYRDMDSFPAIASYLASHSARNGDLTVQVDISNNLREADWLRTTTRDYDSEIEFRPHIELQVPDHGLRSIALAPFFESLMQHPGGGAVKRLFLVDTPERGVEDQGRGYFKSKDLLKEFGHPRMDQITDVIYESGKPQIFLDFLRKDRRRIKGFGKPSTAAPLQNLKVLVIKLREIQNSKDVLIGAIGDTIEDRKRRGAPLQKIFLKNCEWIQQDQDIEWVHSLDTRLAEVRWRVDWNGSWVPPVLELTSTADGVHSMSTALIRLSTNCSAGARDDAMTVLLRVIKFKLPSPRYSNSVISHDSVGNNADHMRYSRIAEHEKYKEVVFALSTFETMHLLAPDSLSSVESIHISVSSSTSGFSVMDGFNPNHVPLADYYSVNGAVPPSQQAHGPGYQLPTDQRNGRHNLMAYSHSQMDILPTQISGFAQPITFNNLNSQTQQPLAATDFRGDTVSNTSTTSGNALIYNHSALTPQTLLPRIVRFPTMLPGTVQAHQQQARMPNLPLNPANLFSTSHAAPQTLAPMIPSTVQSLLQPGFTSTMSCTTSSANLSPFAPVVYPSAVQPPNLGLVTSSINVVNASAVSWHFPDNVILRILLALRDLCQEDNEMDKDDWPDTDLRTWLFVPQVNRAWRNVFIAHKPLFGFSVLDISSYKMFSGPTISRPTRKSMDQIKYRIRRAGGAPLTLRFSQGPDERRHLTSQLCALISLLLQRHGQIRELIIFDDFSQDGLRGQLRHLVLPAPYLEILTLKARPFEDELCGDWMAAEYLHGGIIDISEVIPCPSNLLGCTAPRIHTVTFLGCSVPWKSPILRNGLRYLSVQYPNLSHPERVQPSLGVQPSNYLPCQQDLYEILQTASSSLKHLNLLHALPSAEDFTAIDPVSLPQLETLQIAGRSTDCLSFLQYLKPPPSSSLTVFCDRGSVRDVYHLATYLGSQSARNQDTTLQIDISVPHFAKWLRTATSIGGSAADIRPHVELQTPYLGEAAYRYRILRAFFSGFDQHESALKRIILADTPLPSPRHFRGRFTAATLIQALAYPALKRVTGVVYESGDFRPFLRFLEISRNLPSLKLLILKPRVSLKQRIREDSKGSIGDAIGDMVRERQNNQVPLDRIVLMNCDLVKLDSDAEWVSLLAERLSEEGWYVNWDDTQPVPAVLELRNGGSL
ncbi:hypothetical protein EVG20_g6005 [Dentipellis fragilis]|uniref:Uncharacterized protein n=1 Tax=Dentipellis fragilis TaxID=205917 RepID=A0A4Y9YPD1_9AGAM|nr:hypothetical protein EVG20_g6005 [Dentipellis fragilis]